MFKNNKVNWALAILALIATIVVFLFWQTPSANAHPGTYPNSVAGSNKDDRTNQVTVGELYSLRKNMTRQEVTELLDGPGHVGQKHTRWYRWAGSAPKFVRVIVTYDHNLLKHAYLVAKKANQGTFEVPTDRTYAKNGDDTRNCATVGEWNALKPGMSRHQVNRIMDGPGKLSEPQVRKWKVCPGVIKPGKTAWVMVWFKKLGPNKPQVAYSIYWLQLS